MLAYSPSKLLQFHSTLFPFRCFAYESVDSIFIPVSPQQIALVLLLIIASNLRFIFLFCSGFFFYMKLYFKCENFMCLWCSLVQDSLTKEILNLNKNNSERIKVNKSEINKYPLPFDLIPHNVT